MKGSAINQREKRDKCRKTAEEGECSRTGFENRLHGVNNPRQRSLMFAVHQFESHPL